jgi:hypothetical protein
VGSGNGPKIASAIFALVRSSLHPKSCAEAALQRPFESVGNAPRFGTEMIPENPEPVALNYAARKPRQGVRLGPRLVLGGSIGMAVGLGLLLFDVWLDAILSTAMLFPWTLLLVQMDPANEVRGLFLFVTSPIQYVVYGIIGGWVYPYRFGRKVALCLAILHVILGIDAYRG